MLQWLGNNLFDTKQGAKKLEGNDRSKWTKDIIKSFRLSRELLDLINHECQYRNLDFSAYIRHAATLALKHRSDIRTDHRFS
jgi:hypothetical protein